MVIGDKEYKEWSKWWRTKIESRKKGIKDFKYFTHEEIIANMKKENDVK